MRALLIKNNFIDPNLIVNELIDTRSRAWNINRLKELFFLEDVARISVMKPVVLKDDFWFWKFNRCGDYSV